MPDSPALSSSPGQAIILAAGAGSRLGELVGDGTKALIEIGGRSILRRQVESMAAVGVGRVVVVVGHRPELVREHAATLDADIEFAWVENRRWAETNTLVSLGMGVAALEPGGAGGPGGAGNFLLANGDVLFPTELLRRLTAAGGNALAVETARCAEEEVKVLAQGKDVTDIGKDVDPAAAAGEFTGVALISGAVTGPTGLLAEALSSIEAADGERCFFEEGFRRLIGEGTARFSVVDVSDLPVIEIDFPEDYRRACEDIAPRIDGMEAT